MSAERRLSYRFGAFRLDPIERVLFHQDQPVAITLKAFDTLMALVERHGHVVTKEELFGIVWPDAFVEDNNLAQNISLLRRTLGEGPGGQPFIETVPKRGYRFVAGVVEEVETAADAAGPQPTEPLLQPGAPASNEPPTAPARRSIRRAAIWILIAAVPAAFMLAASLRSRDRSSEVSGDVPPAAADRSRRDAITRIAVLPFINLGSADDEYFVAGMNEEISSRLARLSRLAVTSGTTVTEYDRRGKSLPRVGTDLGVEYVVEGSVRWARRADGVEVRVTPKLIRAADDTVVWTHQYDASLSNLFEVQGDIAYQITRALELALEAGERRSVQARSTGDPDAYLAYLRGIAAYQQSFSDTSLQAQARKDLEEAAARDPRFALAWSWLSRVYNSQYSTGAQRTPETRRAAHRAAQTAIDLDRTLPEACFALAQVLRGDGNYAGALRELELARAAAPNSPDLFRMIGMVEQARGQWGHSLSAYLRAFEFDPASTADLIGIHYLHLRQYDEAARYIGIANAANRAAAPVPDAWMRFSGSGNVADARRVLERALGTRSPADARVRGLLARLEWIDGRHERALELIEGMDASGAWLPANFRFPASIAAAQVYESMGRREDAAPSYTAAIVTLQERLRHAPDDHQVHAALGLAAAGLGRASDAVRHGARAVELLPVTRDAALGPIYVYLLAQIHARLGQRGPAFATLDELFSLPGFYSEHWVRRDPWFAALWKDPQFEAYVRRWSSQKGDALPQGRGSSVRE